MNQDFKPFVPLDFICDSSMHINEVVEQTTSWLTINPMLGCSLSCAYCFREKWHAPDKPYMKTTVEKSLSELIKHPLFIPHITPLSVNVSSTDALLPKVRQTTFEVIKFLDDNGYKNIFGLISKLKIRKQDLQFLSTLKNIRIVFLVSYADIPFFIEPVPIKPRIDNLINLKEYGIPSVLYFRPIVEGWNNSESQIEKVLSIGEKYASAVSIGGLRLSKEIKKVLNDRNVPLPNFIDIYHPKELTDNLENAVLSAYYKLKLKVPLFKHTSCAVSHIFDLPNYNTLFKNPILNCMITCPLKQQKNCGITLNQYL